MAPGCEPLAVTRMMTVLRSEAHGMSLAGAGGGGFLYVLFKRPKSRDQVERLLQNCKVCACGYAFRFLVQLHMFTLLHLCDECVHLTDIIKSRCQSH